MELLSTEGNVGPCIDIYNNTLYPTPKNDSFSSIEFFEKIKKNQESLPSIKEDEESQASCGFWDKFANIFGMFRCEN